MQDITIWLKKTFVLFNNLWSKTIYSELFLTVALIIFCLLIIKIHSSWVRSDLFSNQPMEKLKQRLVEFRNRVGLFFMLSLFIIWGGEIRAILLSIAAITAAVLIVSKELLTNFLGALLFSISKPAKIGDEIEIANFKGELHDISWFHLSLLEHSSNRMLSGKIINVPNSILLTHSITKTNPIGSWRPSTLCIPILNRFSSIAQVELENIGKKHTDKWIESAHECVMEMKKQHLIDTPTATATCLIVPKDKDSAELHLRYFHPESERSETEQIIIKEFYLWLTKQLNEEKRTKPPSIEPECNQN